MHCNLGSEVLIVLQSMGESTGFARRGVESVAILQSSSQGVLSEWEIFYSLDGTVDFSPHGLCCSLPLLRAPHCMFHIHRMEPVRLKAHGQSS